MKWFYSQAAAVFTRSAAYRFKLMDLGVEESKLRLLPAGVDLERFNPRHRNLECLESMGVTKPRRLLYAGRVSVEKNLPLLVDIFRRLCTQRGDVALLVVGDGPYLDEMKRELRGLPVHFTGVRSDPELASLYASSDLFLFPSRTDTLGQVVMEAQACGLPAIVSCDGGPKETVVDDVTGRILSSTDVADWCDAISALLDDEPRRQRMALAAIARSARFCLGRSFEHFWQEHLLAVQPAAVSTPKIVVDLPAADDAASKLSAGL
jgi:glycosyltransferase involved in cell wall biosynthesis